MYHQAKVDLVQGTDVLSRQFVDLVQSPDPAVLDIFVDTASIEMALYPDLMIVAVVVVVHPVVAVAVN